MTTPALLEVSTFISHAQTSKLSSRSQMKLNTFVHVSFKESLAKTIFTNLGFWLFTDLRVTQ